MQGAAFKKDRRSYARPIVNAVALDIKYQPLQVVLDFTTARAANLARV